MVIERSDAGVTIVTAHRQPRSSPSPLLKPIDCHNLEGDVLPLQRFLSAKKILRQFPLGEILQAS